MFFGQVMLSLLVRMVLWLLSLRGLMLSVGWSLLVRWGLRVRCLLVLARRLFARTAQG